MDNCKYYPCHDLAGAEQDCRFCYCPFYSICPTLDPELRIYSPGYWLDRSSISKEPVWACELCDFPHNPAVADYLSSFCDLDDIDYQKIFQYCNKLYCKSKYRAYHLVPCDSYATIFYGLSKGHAELKRRSMPQSDLYRLYMVRTSDYTVKHVKWGDNE
jgi:Zn-finger protein